MLGLGEAGAIIGAAGGATTVLAAVAAGVWRLTHQITATADKLRAEFRQTVAEEAEDRDSQVRTMRDELHLRASLAENQVSESSRRLDGLATSIEEVAATVSRLSESALTRSDFQSALDAHRREMLEHIDRSRRPPAQTGQ